MRWGLFVAVALIVAGCSSDPADPTSEDAGSRAQSQSETNEGDAATSGGAPTVVGAPLNPFDLRAGQCFNEGSWYDDERERRIELTATVDCEQPHMKEVYFEAEFPAPNGAPYPGEAKMTEWSTELCYDSFAEFVGLEYELSRFEITFIQPTEATFEHPVGRHRRVTCILFELDGSEMAGSAQGAQA